MRGQRRLPTAALLAVTLSISFSPQPLLAVDCSTPFPGLGESLGNVFNLTTGGFTPSEVQTAIGSWSCPQYTGEIPTFQVGGSGGVPVLVARIDSNAPAGSEGCGLFTADNSAGYIESATITVWTHASNGDSCPPLTDVLAHEFGHLLGLDNAPDLACAGHIMGRSFGGTSLRTVRSDDCAVADQMWHTSNEDAPNDAYCEAYGCSPILVDLENDGIHLTGIDDPVWFDIDADGTPDLMSWTDRSEGFLALDRNGNGWIDDGGELFGNVTRLANGTQASNGYLALAELDSQAFGGNGNGMIDAFDGAFSSLRMWTDRNHDGVSQPDELQTLDEEGIRRIGLDYTQSRRRDRYGNEYRFRGTAWKVGRLNVERPVLTWDVFFVVMP
jgi:hypothetical protein